ncbi:MULTISPECIES: hypothetical protein [Methylobacterium]|uniref:hypothetical protein n=1 Tax=Methylobacterium TaxID=407 RepID=UPI0028A5CE21|nr:hypothetical protein [Methylobacterium sp. DB0501]
MSQTMEIEEYLFRAKCRPTRRTPRRAIAPGLEARIAASRIVLETTDHAERVLDLMGTFGPDTARYAVHHPWLAASTATSISARAAARGRDRRPEQRRHTE